MRPNHGNNKRMRGRHRNSKPSNPLARSYESNGPDVKVRGNPQHIVEKYSQLARDAQVAGDPVLAEAYLQHAEHYFRIITAAQAAMAQAQGFARGEIETDESGDDDEDMGGFQQPYPDFRQQQQPLQQRNDPGESPQPENNGQGYGHRERQPYQERQGFNDRPPYGERQERGERQPYGERQDRGDRPSYGERQDRGDRQNYGERQDRGDRQNYGERQDRGDRRFNQRGPRQDFRPRRPEPEQESQDAPLPSFITNGAPRQASAPVSAPAAPFENAPAPVEPAPAPLEAIQPPAVDAAEGEARAPYKARRRRRTAEQKAEGGDLPLEPQTEGQPAE